MDNEGWSPIPHPGQFRIHRSAVGRELEQRIRSRRSSILNRSGAVVGGGSFRRSSARGVVDLVGAGSLSCRRSAFSGAEQRAHRCAAARVLRETSVRLPVELAGFPAEHQDRQRLIKGEIARPDRAARSAQGRVSEEGSRSPAATVREQPARGPARALGVCHRRRGSSRPTTPPRDPCAHLHYRPGGCRVSPALTPFPWRGSRTGWTLGRSREPTSELVQFP